MQFKFKMNNENNIVQNHKTSQNKANNQQCQFPIQVYIIHHRILSTVCHTTPEPRAAACAPVFPIDPPHTNTLELFFTPRCAQLKLGRRKSSRGHCTASSTRSRSRCHHRRRKPTGSTRTTAACRRSRWHRDAWNDARLYRATVRAGPVEGAQSGSPGGRIRSTGSWIIRRASTRTRSQASAAWPIRIWTRCPTGPWTTIGYRDTGIGRGALVGVIFNFLFIVGKCAKKDKDKWGYLVTLQKEK